jgi:hypothetical protein
MVIIKPVALWLVKRSIFMDKKLPEWTFVHQVNIHGQEATGMDFCAPGHFFYLMLSPFRLTDQIV